MEAEASSFETSEMLASFLASTQLISESWKLCDRANTTAPGRLIVDQIGGATCLAFSGIQTIGGMSDPCLANLVPLNCADTNRMFSILERHINEGDEDRVMVHSGLLHLFLTLYGSSSFHDQILSIVRNSKSLIITGHSIGGAIASLTTLFLLCYLQSCSITQITLLCITFGSPLLGNDSLSRAILRQRWGGSFCHVITKHDIMPRLLLAPLENHFSQLHSLLQFWHFSMSNSTTSSSFTQIEKVKVEFFNLVFSHLEKSKSGKKSLFWPFGNYVFCCGEGAICVDNSEAIVNMLHVMFMKGSPSSSVEDHLEYGEYVGKVSLQFLSKRRFTTEGEEISDSSYEAGLALALQSSGIATKDSVATPAKECLKMARRMGRTPNLNCANLAILLSDITPYRAQIEWYKSICDKSADQMGYYDSFKQGQASKKDAKINMNRCKLSGFWNKVIHMLDDNQLPHDFHKLSKWVNASQFYKLLVEPLDIAEYYRSGTHRIKGHYMANGRERRHEIFDRWWKEKKLLEGSENNNYIYNKRSKFASLTQDSCFWAHLEEAREWLEELARREGDTGKLAMLWKNLEMFEMYAMKLVETKEVSVDVVAKNSSYTLWLKEWMELKVHFHCPTPTI